MVLVPATASSAEPVVYYREESETARTARFCLKPVRTVQPRTGERRTDSVNVQIVKGKTTTFIQLDEDEAKKVQQHCDAVVKKLQRIHKSAVWNVLIGRSFADRSQRTAKAGSSSAAADEVNLDKDEGAQFDPANPRSWSADSVAFVQSLMKATEFRFDGFVVLFCVENCHEESTAATSSTPSASAAVDYDELAWELEKCLVYHLVSSRPQMIMNEEGAMCRRGLDPVSRKTKTPGRNRAGYIVYMAYQMLESVTQDQIVGEALNRYVDLSQKKRQLLASLTETKLPPQVDEKARKLIKEIKEFMGRDQLCVVDKLRGVRDPDHLDMINQFVHVLQSGGRERSASMMQFVSFLSSGGDDGGGGGGASTLPRSGSRISSIDPGKTAKTSTLPRRTSGVPVRPNSARKASNATFSVSSGGSSAATPESTPRRGGERRIHQRRESSLASIPSNESLSRSSTPETLRKEEHKASAASNKGNSSRNRRSGVPQPTERKGSAPVGRRQQGGTNGRSPGVQSRTDSGSRSGTPRIGSARSSINGDNSPRMTPSSSATGSPRIGSATRRGGRPPPDPDRMITREDLRRMNRSYPSSSSPSSASPRTAAKSAAARAKARPPSSFSRTSIPK